MIPRSLDVYRGCFDQVLLWRLGRGAVLAVAMVFLGIHSTLAQDVGPSGCVALCDDGPSGGGGGGGGGTSTPDQPSGPTQQELQQQLEMAMHEANDRGIESFQYGDWANAIRYFQLALEYSPDDPTVLANLRLALERQAEADYGAQEAERERQEAEAQAAAERERQEAAAQAEAERLRQEAEALAEAERQRRLARAEVTRGWRHTVTRAGRRHKAVAAWRKLVSAYYFYTDPDAEWRVKAQAWWNDPMHRAWVGDAFIIASLPLILDDALAVSQAVLGRGGAAKAGLQAGLAKKPPSAQQLDRVLRSRSQAQSPTGSHYDFPSFYRGETKPPIPNWLFRENPYVQPYPGGRTWYWQEAASVRVKRTPGLDKELKWLLTGEGRF